MVGAMHSPRSPRAQLFSVQALTRLRAGWLAAFLGSTVAAASVRADLNTPAEFKVTDTVVRAAKDFVPLGVDGYGERGTDYAGNNFFHNAGNEPIHWGELFRATNIEGKTFELANQSTGFYELYNDGLLSGASVRIYRIVDQAGNPLPVAENAKQPALANFANIPAGAHVILVGKSHVLAAGEGGFKNGGWVVSDPPAGRKPNRVYLAADAPELQRLDYIVINKDFDHFDMSGVNPRVRGKMGSADYPKWYWNTLPENAAKYAIVPHPGKVPEAMAEPGHTCMQVEASPGDITISQTTFIGTDIPKENLYYGQLEPGKTYRMEVWMCQQGLDNDGQVKFALVPARAGIDGISSAFKVDGQWKKFTYDFTAPPRPKGLHYGPGFSFKGPGKLWIDNARLFRYDKPDDLTAPWVPNRTILGTLVASQPATGPKGTHRSWMLSRDETMDAILSYHPNSRVAPNVTTSVSGIGGRTLPIALGYDYETGTSPETRMTPHIVIQHIIHSEEDWQHFVEYLAAPYDPASDTPQGKPWAYRRYVQRGQNGRPWTDEFREIIVELGNETWHNSLFPDWIGFSLYKSVNQGGPEYGLFSEYLIESMKKSPWWGKARLDDRVHFALGANYGSIRKGEINGYGELAMQRCPAATYLGHANYVGPKWETGDKALSEVTDDGVMATLMAYQSANKESQDNMAEARKVLDARGTHYKLLAYEGGPSGYAVTEKDPKKIQINEQYGKSLAMAVAATDSWLGSYLQGWSAQNYFAFGQGQKWTSHTMMFDGFRPHAGWLAMSMRNHFATGSFVKVDEVQMPTCNFGAAPKAAALPLVGAYAMKDGNRWSIFVLSRKLNGTAAGQNMGNGFNKVTLHLPFTSAASVTLHRLKADPRASNIDGENVKLESLPLGPGAVSAGTLTVNGTTGGGAEGMPPGAIFLYVIEGAK